MVRFASRGPDSYLWEPPMKFFIVECDPSVEGRVSQGFSDKVKGVVPFRTSSKFFLEVHFREDSDAPELRRMLEETEGVLSVSEPAPRHLIF